MSSRAFQIGASEFSSEESQVVLSTIDSLSRFLPSFFHMNARSEWFFHHSREGCFRWSANVSSQRASHLPSHWHFCLNWGHGFFTLLFLVSKLCLSIKSSKKSFIKKGNNSHFNPKHGGDFSTLFKKILKNTFFCRNVTFLRKTSKGYNTLHNLCTYFCPDFQSGKVNAGCRKKDFGPSDLTNFTENHEYPFDILSWF